MTEPSLSISKAEIVHGLTELGVRPGMGLMVHSSLSSFGRVDGGAATVVDALMEVVTPDGTLLMPSFNHGAPFEAGGPGVYDPAGTPTINGAIQDHFWRRPGVARSLDPTHPFSAWGRHAHRYTVHHHRTLTMGADSPLGMLLADGGSCLFLGVTYRVNTFHHVVETIVGAPCLGRRTEAYPVLLPDGRRVLGRTWGWRERSCPFTDGNRYGLEMERLGLHREAQIGQCRAILYRLQDGFEVIARILRSGDGVHPPCRGCPIRPQRGPATVESDWDEERQQIRSDSDAWGY